VGERVWGLGLPPELLLNGDGMLYTLGECHVGRNLFPAIGDHAAGLGRSRSGKELRFVPLSDNVVPTFGEKQASLDNRTAN
jgi:hypothetical protein